MKTINKIKEIFSLFLKLDPFSKLIILMLLIVISTLTYESLTKNNNISKVQKLRQFSKTEKLGLSDYYFNSGFKSRLIMDNTLILKLKEPMSREDYEKLSFEISPKDAIRPEYFDEMTIKIYFDKKMELNERKNTILVLKNNEIILSIDFSNTNFDEDYYRGLNELRVVPNE